MMNKGVMRRQVTTKLLNLWEMMPDEQIGRLIAETFGIFHNGLAAITNEEALEKINKAIEDRRGSIYKTKLHRNAQEYDDNKGMWSDFDSGDYVNAQQFLIGVKKYTGRLTKEEYARIKGMALSGDIEGANRCLNSILETRYQKVRA